MTTTAVAVERHDSILRITLNRPERMNALGVDTLEELTSALRSAHIDNTIRAVVLTGAGKAFCTGADIAALDNPPEAIMDAANSVIRSIVRAPVPVVVAVNGPAAGFGVGLACAADLTYAADSAYFFLSFCKIGLMPDGGATALVAAAIGRARAAEMALLGERLSAADAARVGLVARNLPDDQLGTHVDTVAAELARGPRRALHITKRALNASALDAFDQALERERTGQIELLESKDCAEGLAAFREKRQPDFQQ